MGPLRFTSFNQSRNPPISTSAKGCCYLGALTQSSRNHGVEGAGEKGRPEGRGETLLFASQVRAAAFLPKSINCGGGGGRIPESERGGNLFFFLLLLLSARSRRVTNKLVGGEGKAVIIYGQARVGGDVSSFRFGRWR